QSVAVRLIVDREADIEAFQPEEYWTLDARLATAQDGAVFVARFHERGGQKVQLQNEDEVRALVASLDGVPFRVAKVQRRERRRTAPAPFTTSTLQQEASRKLGFTVRRTMRVAQELYEGLEIAGEGSVGLITYMRTDSTRVSAEAQAEAEAYVRQRWGGDFAAPRSGRVPAGAQDAHEAIRPTSVWRVPEALERDLTRDQYRLYRLIWERFLASQMSAAVYDTVTAVVEAGDASFRATGATLRFPGYAVLYVEGQDEGQQEEAAGALPDLEEGQELRLVAWDPRQHFTEPPPRYSEAMLVKALEEKGIGRPSTYAPIIETIVDRGYVVRQRRRFQPTELGRLVTELLKEHFPEIVSVEFTAQMESRLDAVEAGEVEWRSVVEGFYRRFQPLLERAEAVIERVELPVEETGERCELCDRPMVVKFGRYGKFLACSGYPACKHTRPYLERVGVLCPQCGGDVVERVSRKGRRFYGCKNYPTCNFVSWQRPIAERCPRCGSWMVERTRRGQTFHVCADQACGYAVPVDGEREPVNV
ncbi:MAG: type I DNA topoisomerase, partial [Clostridia bacterium]|nr:type I DNA topoisomerase [Clostridia bacterium]